MTNLGFAQEQVLEAGMVHLRGHGEREWAWFPSQPDARQLTRAFESRANTVEWTLRWRQQDVKQAWRILLNDRELTTLYQDENDLTIYRPIPAGALTNGKNTLRIEPAHAVPDDIRVGQIALEDRPMDTVLSEASLDLEIVDGATRELIPARLTIVGTDRSLHTTGIPTDALLAVRPGIVYTGNGRASFSLPAGTYTLFAGRGTEYSVDSTLLVLAPGAHAARTMTIRREVDTEGWIATDTHLHTLTYSGHGDATVEERALTIAGEGIELPILTDHNVHVDLDSVTQALGLGASFTPVVGNEVTTAVGHFNIFPVEAHARPPDARVTDWEAAYRAIRLTPGVEAIILNHARDLHSGFRPFGPDRHLAVAGRDLDGWKLPANAMEVINSGSQQNDVLRLSRDWFGLLNRGLFVTPVGASDSHDVGRYLVGQARTYIKGRDDQPGQIDVQEALQHFKEGKVLVSFGLFTEVVINGSYGPGELVPRSDSVTVSVRVAGPGWLEAGRVGLYANGQKIREAAISDGKAPGLKWAGTWRLPQPDHDVCLVALAEGPASRLPFWPIANPYQPTSPVWHPRVMGLTGAVWIDADGDGRRTSAYDYARRLVTASKGAIGPLIDALAAYDEAVAVQAASLLQQEGISPADPAILAAVAEGSPSTRRGFQAFMEGWEESQKARALR